MKQYTCLNCGAEFLSDRFRKFCCVRCNKTYLQRNYRAKEKTKPPRLCIHNEGVCCKTNNCTTCGWNPEVSQKRLEAIAGRFA